MGTLLKYEFRRSRTIFLGIIGVTLLVELVYLVGFFTKVQALFTVGLIGGILCLALGAVAILLYGVIMFNDDISKKPGYLLFSTPRSAAQIVGAKLLMTLFALVGITILFSLLIALLSMFDASITENGLKDVLFNGYNFFGLSMYLLNTVISFIFNVIAAYVVIVLLKTVMGNQKGRTILAVILWFAITNAFNLLGGLITTQLASGLDEGNEVVVTQSSTLFLSTSLHTLFQPAMYLPTMILCIIGSIAGYWLTTWIIEKKLSV